MRKCYEEENKKLLEEQRQRRRKLKMNSNEEVLDELEDIIQGMYGMISRLKNTDFEERTKEDIVNGLSDLISELQAAKLEENGEITKGKDYFIYGGKL